jgi:hypothetical protein
LDRQQHFQGELLPLLKTHQRQHATSRNMQGYTSIAGNCFNTFACLLGAYDPAFFSSLLGGAAM